MLFTSFEFLIFFPAVTVLYFLLPQRRRWALLLSASCVFYMAFIPIYILILAFTIVVDYCAGLLIEGAEGARRRRYLILSLAANCGVLAVFKYAGFISANFTAAARLLDIPASLPVLRVVLPIGLSFHTFQAMSYTIEVYRGRQRAERHFGIYALYVLFYPQLVAGPIERPQHLLPQLREAHAFDEARVAAGLHLMLVGFFKKLVIADNLAVYVDPVFTSPRGQDPLSLVVATVSFAFQIYADFSGYSDIAIGAAQVMGITLMTNFNHPYHARSTGEFWKRWHISLSTWFRDYLYIPLGGSRAGRGRWYANLLITFAISGLWHGARWTFVVWGLLNGLYVVSSVATAGLRRRVVAALGLDRRPLIHRAAQVGTTFALTCAAWVFFRADSVRDAVYIFHDVAAGAAHLFKGSSARALTSIAFLWMGFGGLVLLEAAHAVQGRRGPRLETAGWPAWVRWSWYYVLVGGILCCGRFGARQFIYFQF
ncbi:MAG TPA: MBOAT family O-acyltransferase [Vicinamibacterales bacterium]